MGVALDSGLLRRRHATSSASYHGISIASWAFASPDSGSNMKFTIYHVLLSLVLGGAPTLSAQTSPSAETPVVGILPAVPFAACVQKLAGHAQAQGIPPEIIHYSLTNLPRDPDILAGASSQPEFIKPIWDYLDATV
jgi:membrane-bound lytic murein transglycosylase B